MEAVYYEKYNNTYKIEECTVDDVDVHYEMVRSLVDDVDEDTYKKNMMLSVQQKLAYKVSINDELTGFMYNKVEGKIGHGVSIYNKGSIVGFILLLKEGFDEFPSHKILMVPHKGNATYLKALTKGYSIRNYRNHGKPLVVMLSEVREYIKKMYLQMGFE